MRLRILIICALGTAASHPAEAAETCCYANFRFSGPCVVELAPGESCSSVLAYLNDLSSGGKTYCGSTPIRRGWSHTPCPGEVASGSAVTAQPVPLRPAEGRDPAPTVLPGGPTQVVSPQQTAPTTVIGPQAAPPSTASDAVDLDDLRISVRFEEPVDPGSMSEDDEFTGRLDDDLFAPDGSLLAPAGSMTFARAVPSDTGAMRLEVTDVIAGDEVLPVVSSPLSVDDIVTPGEVLEIRVAEVSAVPAGLLDLRRSVAAWVEAFGRGDAEALASLFTVDSMLFPAGGAPVDGRDEIREYFRERFASRSGSVELDQVEVGVDGGLGYKRGQWRELAPSGTVSSSGSFLEVWKRVGDRWLLHRGMWTPDGS